MLGTFFEKLASSASVHTLHLDVVPKLQKNVTLQHETGEVVSLDDLVLGILPKFPTLVTLSLDQEDNVDLQVMERLQRSAISITTWRPEFFQEFPSWDTIHVPRSSHNFNIPVMWFKVSQSFRAGWNLLYLIWILSDILIYWGEMSKHLYNFYVCAWIRKLLL